MKKRLGNTLQKEFENSLLKSIRLEELGIIAIEKRLEEIGINLNKKQLLKIKSQLASYSGDSLSLQFDIEDKQISNAGYKSEDEAKKDIKDILKNFVPDIEISIKKLYESLPSLINNISDESANQMLKSLKLAAPEMLENHHSESIVFESGIYEDWGEALDLLEMFIVASFEAGEAFNVEVRSKAVAEQSYVFDILSRLHARACQVSLEILTLLQAGHADGAHARWRTLHEITAVSILISNHGNDIAERYTLHENIENYKAALQYREHYQVLDYEPIEDKELLEMKQVYDELIERFGSSYRYEYGWAASTINNGKPTFKDIEQAVGLEYMRPYYKMASHNVHANPKGVFFKLGLYDESNDILLAGTSHLGLADPSQSTALSLLQITTVYLNIYPNLDRIVISKILNDLSHEISQKFVDVEETLRSNEGT